MELNQIKQRFGIIGNDPELDRALEIAWQVAPTNLSVLVTGESGTGKEVIPQIIHQYSARKHNVYLALNCGGIPEGTIDSELFGHEKGSFTGAIETRKGYFEEAENQRPRGGRHQRQPARRHPRRQVPRRPVLPALHRAHHHAPAARAQGRHPPAVPEIRPRLLRPEHGPARAAHARRAGVAAQLPLARQRPAAPERGRPPLRAGDEPHRHGGSPGPLPAGRRVVGPARAHRNRRSRRRLPERPRHHLQDPLPAAQGNRRAEPAPRRPPGLRRRHP